MIAAHARANGVPFALANAVVRVESSYNPHALSAGNYGLMQIRPQTARGLGYRGPASGLLNAETNLRYGVKYLAVAYHHAHGDTCRALMGYQSGVFARHMSSANHRYCHKALVYMAQG
ncbi:MAG: transglycosylase SLT domain-containing protein [Hyphomicrobiales bacterium]|nr:transglycosylase SLT domain-containing protein [Hyphomicrobiales bacterium]MDE2115568.1 transglycosylase SLT domain-containing protein [Hyphomicrobiales bacterium]